MVQSKTWNDCVPPWHALQASACGPVWMGKNFSAGLIALTQGAPGPCSLREQAKRPCTMQQSLRRCISSASPWCQRELIG